MVMSLQIRFARLLSATPVNNIGKAVLAIRRYGNIGASQFPHCKET
jgi:hypothetical protein